MRLRPFGRRRESEDSPGGDSPTPFIVGVNRSGTTLLRMMLDAHPEMAIPPETHFIPDLKQFVAGGGATPESTVAFLVSQPRWDDFGLDPGELLARLAGRRVRTKRVLKAFFGLYAEKRGKRRWGDKTPGYVKQMGLVQRVLPQAHFIHLIRDGRDVAISREGRQLREPLSVGRLARIWKRRISRARRQSRRLDHYMEVRYEDLVARPEATLRQVCDFIELEYDPAMLDYHVHAGERLEEIARDLPTGDGVRPAAERLEAHSLVNEPPRVERAGRWHELMSPEEVAEFEAVAGDLLADLGYERAARETPGAADGAASR